ncbi:hypothetical protein ACTG42_06015 [Acinetobacter baumannii]|uniref:hypothetical protein n=1 Tax=Acinetobacter baumannii TaxID=470 RepID=UPI003F837C93
MKDQYKKVSQKHMLGFMYYLQLLGYVIVRQGMDQAMFLTKHYAVPVAWRRITIDYHNRLNKPAQQLYKEFVDGQHRISSDFAGKNASTSRT